MAQHQQLGWICLSVLCACLHAGCVRVHQIHTVQRQPAGERAIRVSFARLELEFQMNTTRETCTDIDRTHRHRRRSHRGKGIDTT